MLGGSFNPIHNGHLALAEAARERLALRRVLLVPNRLPPHKDSGTMAAASHRLRMVQLAVADDPAFEASDVELRREGPSYTLHTICELLDKHPSWDIHFLIGADTLPELPTWYHIGELASLCKFVVANRPGEALDHFDALRPALTDAQIAGIRQRVIGMPPTDISSTAIRRRVAGGQPLDGLVPAAVADYISRNGLYR
ncbi:nicotinate (nicotinamide) nucleotide adenylyltransferase [bacterium]|nr:nicotinate (nicotinamide) nucleotide adenylyltransferase [bacterium]